MIKLTDLVREAVRLRDNNCCQWCGKPVRGSNSHSSHVIPKSRSLFLRYDLLNVKVLCTYCHRKWHDNPLAAAEWFKARFPARWNYLKELEHKQVRWRMDDLRQIQKGLEEKIKELKEALSSGKEK